MIKNIKHGIYHFSNTVRYRLHIDDKIMRYNNANCILKADEHEQN